MTVKWERFSGSTDAFAIRLAFIPDPDSGAGAEPDESESWGALQIWVDGQNLCAHTDQAETLQSAHWYLLSFLEWVANSWNPLLHEERLPNRNVGLSASMSLDATRLPPSLATDMEALAWEEEWYEWRERHSIRSARDGGLLPSVTFRRLRDSVEISWDDEPLAGSGDSFRFNATGGVAMLPPAAVAKPLFEVTSQAAEYLLGIRPESARLQKLSSVLSGLSDVTQEEDRLGWMAGLRAGWQTWQHEAAAGLGDLTKQAWLGVRQTIEQLRPDAARAALETDGHDPLVISGSCQAALLFGSVAPSVTQPDVLALSRMLVDQFDESGVSHERLVHSFESAPVVDHIPAWVQGYELAESLHDDLEVELSGEFVDVASFIDSLGIEVKSATLEDASIRACSLIGPLHKPTIALNSSYFGGQKDAVRRFTLAHELCHLLYDRSSGQRLAIASGNWAPVALERRANAFAAMFLMPPHLLRQAIADSPHPITERAGIEFLCHRLKVNFTALVEHLYNQTFMTEQEKERLLGRSTS
ncbi:ImmA/IrrE family metallo-endopeptidase [Streptomyces zaomyceticus]|uniref:ImmA/IrrE family metallo-endopeptidase n=1 Tax=Streptomyces zaomyceticus TaxID=68286 RepID=UPI0016784BEF|nr:ImmA/IrrE family metallo-endopeptidase [Streptomyces zaomyceticus]GHG29672.1 hypothetical protein GCM10018791_52570 [Streptomyces zaomyceticus]